MSEKYEFIADCAATAADGDSADAPSIQKMCTWLKVSKSGFYDWRGRPMSATARRREELAVKIQALFDYNDGVYGYR
ncbi:hypothetical protein F7O44_09880, partial [Phytoactinopolyspora sp. XMNu-373]|nr:hypothetical protein [Phytoactinopolyspora mesophila]